MNRIVWWGLGAIAIAAGCTGGDPDPASVKGGDPDAGPVSINGDAKDFSFTIAGPTTSTTIMQGGKALVTVVVARKPDLDALKLPISVKVGGSGKITGQTTIPPDGTNADVELTADASADQGDTKLDLVADAGDKATALGSIQVFVRGQPGSIDTTFATGGVYKGPAEISVVRSVFVLPDGKILYGAACSTPTPKACISRLLSNGTPDPTYGTNGTASIDGPIKAMALQPDGKVLFAGRQPNTTDTFLLTRVLPDGSGVDTAFGTSGVATLKIPDGNNNIDCVVAVGPDKSIAVGFNWIRPSYNAYWPAFFHLDAAGKPVGSDASGLSFLSMGSTNDRLIGIGFRSDNSNIFGSGSVNTTKLGVFQALPNGTLDPFFGTSNGVSAFNWNVSQVFLPGGVLEQASHKIVVLALSADAVGQQSVVTRFANNGTAIDTGFGVQGESQRLDGYPTQVVRDSKERLVVGTSPSTGGTAIYRLTTDGSPDASFGASGKVLTTNPLFGALSLAVGPDDRIVTFGFLGDPYKTPWQAVLVRYWP